MAVQTSEAIEGAPADQRRPAVRGHALALVTVVVWAVTFVSTKVLLVHLAPIEILFFRFVIGFVALALLRPRILHVRGFKEERWFMLAGATGVTVYYLLENIALTFTTASIVGVVVAAAPLFTGVASAVVLKERLRAPFFVGFAVAMAGVCLVSFAGGASGGLVAEGGLGQAGLIGVALALAAAGTWAVYSIVTKKLSTSRAARSPGVSRSCFPRCRFWAFRPIGARSPRPRCGATSCSWGWARARCAS